MRTPNSKCEICGKESYRQPSELKKAMHICCRGCRSALYKKYPEIVKNLDKGWGWNKGMSKANGDDLSYGKPRSDKTKQNISKALKGKGAKEKVKVICATCGKEIYLLPCEAKRRKFCSEDCVYQNQGLREKQSEFMVKRNEIQCYRDTDIELLLEDWLIEEGIEYEKHKPILGMTNPDFFIEPNICLYADGNYWHSISKVAGRDKGINKKLKQNGYKVIRLWGSDIKNGVRPKL